MDRLPQGSNIVVHPASIKFFAERLKANRAKRHMTIYQLDSMGELPRLVRDIVESATLHKDPDKRLVMEVKSGLEPFIRYVKAPQRA